MMSEKTAYQATPVGAKKPNKTSAEAENTDGVLHVASEETAAPVGKKLTTEEVRQGHTGDHVRYILIFSISGILAVLVVLLGLYAF